MHAVAAWLQVMVYDVAAREQLWCTQPGHTETIFDCCCAPGASAHLLATCSFDGTVRVWDVTTNSCVKTLQTKAPGHEDIVVVKGECKPMLLRPLWLALHAVPLVYSGLVCHWHAAMV